MCNLENIFCPLSHFNPPLSQLNTCVLLKSRDVGWSFILFAMCAFSWKRNKFFYAHKHCNIVLRILPSSLLKPFFFSLLEMRAGPMLTTGTPLLFDSCLSLLCFLVRNFSCFYFWSSPLCPCCHLPVRLP